MKPSGKCAPCILHWVYERAAARASEKERFQLMKELLNVLSIEFHSTANLGLVCNRTVDAVYNFNAACPKHYKELKSKSNQYVSELLPEAQDFINKGETSRERFMRACYLASTGNVAPIGAPSDGFTFNEVEEIIKGNDPLPVVMGNIYEAVQGASQVFYVADNAGEIGFDALLIAQLKEMGVKVNLIVKGPHFFEDASMEDASFFGLDKLVDNLLTTKGVFVPSECTQPVADAFAQSDLVIVKGTGNYEALKGELEGKETIYMLKVKCQPVSEKMGKEMGHFIVKLEK